jgi:selT/selW/selH-like putative selenoprotein
MTFQVEPYPVPPLKQMVGQLLSSLFFVGLAVAFVGNKFLPANISEWIGNNSMIFYGALFVCQMVGNGMLQTGAFEISIDGKLVHSKLQSGGLPDVRSLAATIQKAITSSS